MPDDLFTLADLEVLKQWDTPTICNALEVVVPERRATASPSSRWRPTPRRRRSSASRAPGRSAPRHPPQEPRRGSQARLDWFDYVADADLPTIVVLQDLDDRPGYGAFWGEVQSNLHKALGALGCVTNGSFRDLTAWAKGSR